MTGVPAMAGLRDEVRFEAEVVSGLDGEVVGGGLGGTVDGIAVVGLDEGSRRRNRAIGDSRRGNCRS